VHRGDRPGQNHRAPLDRKQAVLALRDVQEGGRRMAVPYARCRPDIGLGLTS
jgi:hypothetical protein